MSISVRKCTFENVPSVEIQISLRLHAFCAYTLHPWLFKMRPLGAFWIAKDVKFLNVDNEDSDQTTSMHSMI